jgi:hypothetical protein
LKVSVAALAVELAPALFNIGPFTLRWSATTLIVDEFRRMSPAAGQPQMLVHPGRYLSRREEQPKRKPLSLATGPQAAAIRILQTVEFGCHYMMGYGKDQGPLWSARIHYRLRLHLQHSLTSLRRQALSGPSRCFAETYGRNGEKARWCMGLLKNR